MKENLKKKRVALLKLERVRSDADRNEKTER